MQVGREHLPRPHQRPPRHPLLVVPKQPHRRRRQPQEPTHAPPRCREILQIRQGRRSGSLCAAAAAAADGGGGGDAVLGAAEGLPGDGVEVSGESGGDAGGWRGRFAATVVVVVVVVASSGQRESARKDRNDGVEVLAREAYLLVWR